MIFAAGLGERMRPRSLECPKPLIEVAGKPLIEHSLGRLRQASVSRFVINSHYLAWQVADYFSSCRDCQVLFESVLLETGGGVVNGLECGALPRDRGFWAVNSDSLWDYAESEGGDSLVLMRRLWDRGNMDALLMLCPLERAYGYYGEGDFVLGEDGACARFSGAGVPLVFCGVQILNPSAFAEFGESKFSLNKIYDRAIRGGRLFGLVHCGGWFHVGMPDDIAKTEKLLADRG